MKLTLLGPPFRTRFSIFLPLMKSHLIAVYIHDKCINCIDKYFCKTLQLHIIFEMAIRHICICAFIPHKSNQHCFDLENWQTRLYYLLKHKILWTPYIHLEKNCVSIQVDVFDISSSYKYIFKFKIFYFAVRFPFFFEFYFNIYLFNFLCLRYFQ